MENEYVGTLVGESTSREFRLALSHGTLREQDLIAVDADIPETDGAEKRAVRVWAKVQRIERLNPLFPAEAGHELAASRINPFDTVLSLSREMVTAVCQVLGTESQEGSTGGKLEQLRYPAQPASTAYRPTTEDVKRVVVGDPKRTQKRGLSIATLSNRRDVEVRVDGHAIVSRHLAILAMTGAGKSWTARKIIEELAQKNYPIVIFDPHGDYSGLSKVEELQGRVQRYFARFPLFEEDAETVAEIVSNLGYALSDTMRTRFTDLFAAARAFADVADSAEHGRRQSWLEGHISRPEGLAQHGLQSNLWLLGYLSEAAESLIRDNNQTEIRQLENWGWRGLGAYTGTDARTLEGIKKRTLRAAAVLTRMELTNQRVARDAEPLPSDRRDLVRYGGVSVVSLAGYTPDFQATIFSLVADAIFDKRVRNDLQYPVLLLLEEAHTFAPASPTSPAQKRAITVTRQISQEGRKFGIGLVVVSQRPSRLDETTLSQCNSFVIMRMVNPADQSFVRRVVETLGEDEAKMLPDLHVGEALLSGQMINFPVLVRIKPPVSQGEHEEADAFEELERIHRSGSRSSSRSS